MKNRTIVVLAVVGFLVWLLFHFATKQIAEKATLATIKPTAPRFEELYV